MNFRRGQGKEELEINLIPLIDVLLVIIIFLMLTTTYSRFSGLEISLPSSDAPPSQTQPEEISVVINAAGEVLVNKTPVGARDIDSIVAALRRVAPDAAEKSPLVVINGDAKANFQAVFDVMQAAQKAGLPNVSFAAQTRR
ncbi:MAG: biopolymer transporter ExbD [Candidatus Dactylopiibacterium sp.]|nr:biopolymer transporter ExbD [Candidatus Dactylopiibacterium sp.]